MLHASLAIFFVHIDFLPTNIKKYQTTNIKLFEIAPSLEYEKQYWILLDSSILSASIKLFYFSIKKSI